MKRKINRITTPPLEDEPTYGFNVTTSNVETVKESTLINFLIIFIGAIGIAIVSGALRVQGIVVLFKVDYIYALAFVIVIIIAEIAIARGVMVKKSDTSSTIIKYIVFGGIQLVLFCLSFVIEYSTLANFIIVQKDTVEFNSGKVKDVRDNISDYERNIQMIQNNLVKIPQEQQSLIQKNMKKIDELTKKKDTARKELKALENDISVKTAMTEKSGLSNTARLFKIDELTLGNYIAIALAGILNILYVSLIWLAMQKETHQKR